MTLMDDLERAVIYILDESGATPLELKVGADTIVSDLNEVFGY